MVDISLLIHKMGHLYFLRNNRLSRKIKGKGILDTRHNVDVVYNVCYPTITMLSHQIMIVASWNFGLLLIARIS